MEQKQCYAFKHNSEEIRRCSTSGGAFSALAEAFIEQNGVVYGATLSKDDMLVRHIRIDSIEEISKLQGSKYLQSIIGDVYKQVKNDLAQGRNVLFSGTPCQIAGLKKYVRLNYNGLFTCDIICHGVSSPLIWQDYILFKEMQLGGKVKDVCFRDKQDYLWSNCKEIIYVENTNTGIIQKESADEYAQIFYEHEAMRPSCYQCRFTNLERPGDITLGDFWEIEKTHPEIYDEIGVSFVMTNSEKGNKLVDILSSKGDIVKAALNETRQPQLYRSVRKPSTRHWFWSKYETRGIEYIIQNNLNKYSIINIRRWIIFKTKSVVKVTLAFVRSIGRNSNE